MNGKNRMSFVTRAPGWKMTPWWLTLHGLSRRDTTVCATIIIRIVDATIDIWRTCWYHLLLGKNDENKHQCSALYRLVLSFGLVKGRMGRVAHCVNGEANDVIHDVTLWYNFYMTSFLACALRYAPSVWNGLTGYNTQIIFLIFATNLVKTSIPRETIKIFHLPGWLNRLPVIGWRVAAGFYITTHDSTNCTSNLSHHGRSVG